MKTATISKVYEVANNRYENNQVELALRVLLSNGRRCWLVGFGGDYRPATKAEIANLDYPVKYVGQGADYFGMVVRSTING